MSVRFHYSQEVCKTDGTEPCDWCGVHDPTSLLTFARTFSGTNTMLVKFLIKKEGEREREGEEKGEKRKKEKEGKEREKGRRKERTNLLHTLHVPLNRITTVSGVCFSGQI